MDLYSSILPRLDMTRISWVMPAEAEKMANVRGLILRKARRTTKSKYSSLFTSTKTRRRNSDNIIVQHRLIKPNLNIYVSSRKTWNEIDFEIKHLKQTEF